MENTFKNKIGRPEVYTLDKCWRIRQSCIEGQMKLKAYAKKNDIAYITLIKSFDRHNIPAILKVDFRKVA